MIAFRESYLTENKKSKTINRKLSAIKKALAGIADNHLSPKSAMLFKQALNEIKGVKLNNNVNQVTKARVLSREEISRLIEEASERLSLMIEFLYNSGCRVSEVYGIKFVDIQEKDDFFTVNLLGKGNKLRKIKMKKELVERIREFFDGEEFLFENQSGKPYRR